MITIRDTSDVFGNIRSLGAPLTVDAEDLYFYKLLF